MGIRPRGEGEREGEKLRQKDVELLGGGARCPFCSEDEEAADNADWSLDFCADVLFVEEVLEVVLDCRRFASRRFAVSGLRLRARARASRLESESECEASGIDVEGEERRLAAERVMGAK